MDRLSRLAWLAAQDALERDGAAPAAERLGAVVLGTAYGSHLTNELFWRGTQDEGGTGGASPTLFAYTLPSSAAAELAITLHLHGPSITLAQGRGAGLAALAEAARLVETNAADWAIAGAVDVLSPTLLRARGSAGDVLSEGAALAVVSSEERGPRLARIAGWAQARGESAAGRAEALALGQAQLSTSNIRLRLRCGVGEQPGSVGQAVGSSGAALPLLELWLALSERSTLPLLLEARDPSGTVDVLCLSEP